MGVGPAGTPTEAEREERAWALNWDSFVGEEELEFSHALSFPG